MKINHAQVAARYRSITHWLTIEGRVDVVEAAARLGVAQETIRRDLRSLEQQGKLQRVHGGAVPVEANVLPLAPPLSISQNDDLALSQRVWEDLPRYGTLLLGAGRLTLTLAQVILNHPPDESGLTVVTNSLDAALVLSRASKLSVYNIGGTVSPVTRAQEGDWALHELSRFSVDITVICPAGISIERGLSQDTPAAAAVSQAEIAAGRRVIAVADAQTLGASAFVQFATLDQIDQIVVAGSASGAVLQPFFDRGISLSVVRTDQSDQGRQPAAAQPEGGVDVSPPTGRRETDSSRSRRSGRDSIGRDEMVETQPVGRSPASR